MKRRNFLKSVGVSLSGLIALPGEAWAQAVTQEHIANWKAQVLAGPRALNLIRQVGKSFETLTPNDSMYALGEHVPVGYVNACYFLRDTAAGRVTYMQEPVLDILYCLQRWMAEEGMHAPLVITSAFRTQSRNDSIEGAAKNSLHVQGAAIDIRSTEVDATTLARMATILQMGGVGFYPNRNFVHIDCGTERRWGRLAHAKMKGGRDE